MVRWNGYVGHVVDDAEHLRLEDAVPPAAGQRFDESRYRLPRAVLVFGKAHPVGLQTDRRAVDPQPSVFHGDAVAGKSDDAFDPNLRKAAGPAEHDNVAAARQHAEDALRVGQRDEDRQRRGAVAVRIFGRQQFIADLQRRLHRARRHVIGLGNGGLPRNDDQNDKSDIEHALDPAFHSLNLPRRAPRNRRSARAADRNAVDAQRRLTDADRHALAVLAAGADAVVERKIVADHGDAMQVGRAVADQHRALDRGAYFAVLDAVGLGALEHIFTRGDVDLAAAEIGGV